MTDTEWAFFEPFVITTGGKSGRAPEDHRRVLDGVFWIARTGAPWRDLHEYFGKWSSVYRQFRRWTLAGIWELMLRALNENEGPQRSVQMIDSTVVRAQKGDSETGFWPLEGWLHDQNSSPHQRRRAADHGGDHRRGSLGLQGLRSRDGHRRAGTEGSHRRQGLRRRPHPRAHRSERWRRDHSDASRTKAPGPDRRPHLRPQKPHRALLQQTQERAAPGNQVRQNRRKLSGLHPHRLTAPVDQTLCQRDLGRKRLHIQ